MKYSEYLDCAIKSILSQTLLTDDFVIVEDGKLKAIISVGSVYTLTYLIRMGLKQKDIRRPEQTLQLRATLCNVMSLVAIGGLSQKHVTQAINDIATGKIS